MKVFSHAEVIAKVEHFIKQHGTATAAAEAVGVYSPQMHIARKKGVVCPAIAAAIGIERGTFYVDSIDPKTQP